MLRRSSCRFSSRGSKAITENLRRTQADCREDKHVDTPHCEAPHDIVHTMMQVRHIRHSQELLGLKRMPAMQKGDHTGCASPLLDKFQSLRISPMREQQ